MLSFIGLFNAGLSPERYWRGPRSQDVPNITLSPQEVGTGGDRDPRRWGKRETVPNITLSPPEVGTGGDRDPRRLAGGLYLTLHCHQQNDSGIQIGSSESYFKGSLSVGCRTEQGEATRGVEPTSSVFLAADVYRNV